MTRQQAKEATLRLLLLGTRFRIIHNPYEDTYAAVHVAAPRFYAAHPVTRQIWYKTYDAAQAGLNCLRLYMDGNPDVTLCLDRI